MKIPAANAVRPRMAQPKAKTINDIMHCNNDALSLQRLGNYLRLEVDPVCIVVDVCYPQPALADTQGP